MPIYYAVEHRSSVKIVYLSLEPLDKPSFFQEKNRLRKSKNLKNEPHDFDGFHAYRNVISDRTSAQKRKIYIAKNMTLGAFNMSIVIDCGIEILPANTVHTDEHRQHVKTYLNTHNICLKKWTQFAIEAIQHDTHETPDTKDSTPLVFTPHVKDYTRLIQEDEKKGFLSLLDDCLAMEKASCEDLAECLKLSQRRYRFGFVYRDHNTIAPYKIFDKKIIFLHRLSPIQRQNLMLLCERLAPLHDIADHLQLSLTICPRESWQAIIDHADSHDEHMMMYLYQVMIYLTFQVHHHSDQKKLMQKVLSYPKIKTFFLENMPLSHHLNPDVVLFMAQTIGQFSDVFGPYDTCIAWAFDQLKKRHDIIALRKLLYHQVGSNLTSYLMQCHQENILITFPADRFEQLETHQKQYVLAPYITQQDLSDSFPKAKKSAQKTKKYKSKKSKSDQSDAYFALITTILDNHVNHHAHQKIAPFNAQVDTIITNLTYAKSHEKIYRHQKNKPTSIIHMVRLCFPFSGVLPSMLCHFGEIQKSILAHTSTLTKHTIDAVLSSLLLHQLPRKYDLEHQQSLVKDIQQFKMPIGLNDSKKQCKYAYLYHLMTMVCMACDHQNRDIVINWVHWQLNQHGILNPDVVDFHHATAWHMQHMIDFFVFASAMLNPEQRIVIQQKLAKCLQDINVAHISLCQDVFFDFDQHAAQENQDDMVLIIDMIRMQFNLDIYPDFHLLIALAQRQRTQMQTQNIMLDYVEPLGLLSDQVNPMTAPKDIKKGRLASFAKRLTYLSTLPEEIQATQNHIRFGNHEYRSQEGHFSPFSLHQNPMTPEKKKLSQLAPKLSKQNSATIQARMIDKAMETQDLEYAMHITRVMHNISLIETLQILHKQYPVKVKKLLESFENIAILPSSNLCDELKSVAYEKQEKTLAMILNTWINAPILQHMMLLSFGERMRKNQSLLLSIGTIRDWLSQTTLFLNTDEDLIWIKAFFKTLIHRAMQSGLLGMRELLSYGENITLLFELDDDDLTIFTEILSFEPSFLLSPTPLAGNVWLRITKNYRPHMINKVKKLITLSFQDYDHGYTQINYLSGMALMCSADRDMQHFLNTRQQIHSFFISHLMALLVQFDQRYQGIHQTTLRVNDFISFVNASLFHDTLSACMTFNLIYAGTSEQYFARSDKQTHDISSYASTHCCTKTISSPGLAIWFDMLHEYTRWTRRKTQMLKKYFRHWKSCIDTDTTKKLPHEFHHFKYDTSHILWLKLRSYELMLKAQIPDQFFLIFNEKKDDGISSLEDWFSKLPIRKNKLYDAFTHWHRVSSSSLKPKKTNHPYVQSSGFDVPDSTSALTF